MRAKSPAGVYTPTHSSDVHPASDGPRRGKARGIQRARMRWRNENSHSQSATPPPSRSRIRIRDRRHLRAPHEEVQYVEDAVRSSKGKHKAHMGRPRIGYSTSKRAGTTSAHPQASAGPRRMTSASAPQNDIHPTQGNGRTERCKREPSKFRIPPIEERKDRQKDRHSPTKQLPTSTAVCGPGWHEQRSRRERTGGAVVLEDRPCVVVLVVLRSGFRRAFVRTACDVVLRLMRVAVAGGGD
ncbi:hypothetical protein DFH09DRAFT_1269563 [Mycena vulgaris]|nr:hypothetical protein DFH09DRAFT_1269563 [Mycena vulgaris]